jgi:site-specific recombinase XerC
LSANNDYEAVQAWLSLQESIATQRAYRKEAERLILWAILERSKALSSLTTEDAIAYRQFLRRPLPRDRWIGAGRPRSSNEWRPFQGALSPRSVAYALSVIGALFRWLIEQRYSLANPFAGVKVGSGQGTVSKAERGERRLDVIELRDWLQAMDLDFVTFVRELDRRLHMHPTARTRPPRKQSTSANT